MIAELVDPLLIVGLSVVFLPAIVVRIVDHRPDEIVGIDHPSDLRANRHIRRQDRLLIGDLEAKGRADRRYVGLVDGDVDLRPDVLLVQESGSRTPFVATPG